MKKRIFPLLLILLTLLGCNSKSTEDPAETIPVSLEETTIPETTAPVIDPLEELVDSMTVEEQVGQLFLARYPGAEDVLEGIERYHIGSFLLFGKDTKDNTPESLTAELAILQKNTALPLLIAVDEEGGLVSRISSYSQYRQEPFPYIRDLYQEGGLELILDTEAEKCQLLRSLGINVNLAPVCDITTDPSAFMYHRSLGLEPEETGKCIAAIVDLMASEGIGGALKHFPGYGNNVDTHVETAVDSRSLEELEGRDLIPFQAGIDAGCDAIMVSHTIINAIDPDLPASLSPAVVAYLRQTMGFEGVIITDDLVMDAITNTYGVGESAVLAVLAGNDLLCSSEYETQYQAVLQAVQEERIDRAQLRNSPLRVLRWKQSLGLI